MPDLQSDFKLIVVKIENVLVLDEPIRYGARYTFLPDRERLMY